MLLVTYARHLVGPIRLQALIGLLEVLLRPRRPEQRADHDQQQDQRQVSGEQPNATKGGCGRRGKQRTQQGYRRLHHGLGSRITDDLLGVGVFGDLFRDLLLVLLRRNNDGGNDANQRQPASNSPISGNWPKRLTSITVIAAKAKPSAMTNGTATEARATYFNTSPLTADLALLIRP